ncbi:MAG: hypothetical protein HY062_14555 [Bacteroidetes bacterium]|nr:hypothetical protein [Bacteroidota bacterium]
MENTNSNLINLSSVNDGSDAALFVSGELYNSGCSLFGTEILIYDHDTLVQKFICCLNGFFYFKLDYEKLYKIVISKSDLETRVIYFNTNLYGFPFEKRQYRFGLALKPLISKAVYLPQVSENISVKFNYKTELFEHNVQFDSQSKKVA